MLAAGQGAGGELLDQSFIVREQALEQLGQSVVGAAGEHVVGCLAGPEQDGHHE
ncbi:hypothetical protein [Streptomyces sp. NPDC002671]